MPIELLLFGLAMASAVVALLSQGIIRRGWALKIMFDSAVAGSVLLTRSPEMKVMAFWSVCASSVLVWIFIVIGVQYFREMRGTKSS